MYSSLVELPMRLGSEGDPTHSVLNWRVSVRSLRGRFGSHRMSTRLPAPPTEPLTLLTPVSCSVKPWCAPLRMDEIPEICQLSVIALLTASCDRPGIRYE